MALEVIGAGFGRTGTMTLKIALEKLGFDPCYHMMEVMRGSSKTAERWLSAVNGHHTPEWEKLFKGYRAAVDWPALHFLPELLEKYPQAKVILTERDAESWYESARATIFKAIRTTHGTWVPMQQKLAIELIIEKTFHSKVDDKKYAIDVYQKHVDWVKSNVSQQRLICFDVADGWEALCSQLGLPTPNTPFPHFNTSSEFKAKFEEVLI